MTRRKKTSKTPKNGNIRPVQEPQNQSSPPQGTCTQPSSRPSTAADKPTVTENTAVIVPASCEPEKGSPSSSKTLTFPIRPGFGQLGNRCTVKANHFLAELSKKNLNQYDVTITPEVTSRALNRAIIAELVKVHSESELGMRLPAYDGRKSLYTAGELPFACKEFTINLINKEDNANPPKTKREYKVVIKFVAKADMPQSEQFLQIINTVLREIAMNRENCSMVPVGRSFFSTAIGEGPKPLGYGLEAWRGFYHSIRPIQMGLSLNINMTSSVFIEALKVTDFVSKLLGNDVMLRQLSDSNRMKVKNALRGVKVEVTHRGNVRRKYRASGITTKPTRELKFQIDGNSTMKSVVEYFQETYNYTIQHTHLPCLELGDQKKKANYMPMEVCNIVKGQRYTKRLSDKQITDFLKLTCQIPEDREKEILDTVQKNNYDQDKYAQEFGMRIDTNLTLVNARILPAPQLKYHETICWPNVGKWSMRNKKMVNGMTVRRWACINFSKSVPDYSAKNFCEALARTCQESGMEFNQKAVYISGKHVHVQVEEDLNKLNGKELDLLLAILPDINGSLYGDLKRKCETDLGIISQCCLAKHVLNRKEPYLANVSLKINVKMGGRNTVLSDAVSRRIPLVTDRPTIIFGADVTHPERGQDTRPSIAAVVASQDWPEVTKYAGLVSAQAHRQEIIQDLFKMTKDLMVSFFKATNQKPQRIIFYRDGVSEGQFRQVLQSELKAIRDACESLEPNYKPPITFIVVQKRHHTRLFATDHHRDMSGNILPGTVVDTKICHPTQFDFYLCSHAGIQGTSRPTHYHVLRNENKFTADGIQLLTYKLCYTYARCTRSVSVVPPAYYAHLAAFRARFYMEPDDHVQESSSDNVARVEGKAVRPLPEIKESIKKVMYFC